LMFCAFDDSPKVVRPDGRVRAVHDVHREGLFGHATWLALFRKIEDVEYDPFVMGGLPVPPGPIAPRSVACMAKADACSRGAGSVVVLELRPRFFERQLRVSADING
jgi:hypothetical protein